MKNINLHTYITTFVLLFVLATICSLIGYAYDQETLVFTPTTEFLLKLYPVFKFPTEVVGYSMVAKGIYGLIGGLVLSVSLYSFVFERFVFCLKSLKRVLVYNNNPKLRREKRILEC
ncbi:hypothetical protein [Aquimarina sediminis]|uniref:hypothetical protein n=1 Tax=Aquimarina sediminis TaxID=2070536 RepID=UPI000CA06406|nr:hypothetical protein [Aquimarina sediminis]